MSAERLQQLKDMLAARMDGQGRAKPGFKRNITAVQAEIRRLEAVQALVAKQASHEQPG